jgi:UDP-3-O-[3-hydroxymyristoyl] glucosamine N-acyltransferase
MFAIIQRDRGEGIVYHIKYNFNMELVNIVEKLNELNVEFEIIENVTLDNDVQFKPASLKSEVPNGIYFIQHANADWQTNIKGSILITNRPLGSDNIEIVVSNPQLTHYKLTHYFVKDLPTGIHPTAIISENAQIGKDVFIGPFSVIGDCNIGDRVRLNNHVVIEDGVVIKNDCVIDSNSVIGAGGMAWIWDEEGNRIMQPQIGGVIIEEKCLIATDVTIVKGSLSENTVIGPFTVIAHGTKIGHGSQVGSHVHMANNVSLAGNAIVGDSSFLGSACVISSNIRVPSHTLVGAAALVNKNFNEEYLTIAGVPALIINRNNFETKPNGAPQPFKTKK